MFRSRRNSIKQRNHNSLLLLAMAIPFRPGSCPITTAGGVKILRQPKLVSCWWWTDARRLRGQILGSERRPQDASSGKRVFRDAAILTARHGNLCGPRNHSTGGISRPPRQVANAWGIAKNKKWSPARRPVIPA